MFTFAQPVIPCFFLGGVRSLLTELLAVGEMLADEMLNQ